MRKKNIVMFYRFKKPNEATYFDRLGEKSSVYRYYFQRGTGLGFNMYFVSGAEGYLGGLKFLNPLFFDGKIFKQVSGVVQADAIFDRSGGVSFPPASISKKVLNPIAFKKICWDKTKTYGYLKKYMPQSWAISSKKELLSKLSCFPDNKMLVLKPTAGLGGKGIMIGRKKDLAKARLKRKPHVLQEFVDTSGGIRGVVRGRHDLRVAVANGKMVLAHVRAPRPGGLLANVAQGGSIKELPLEKIPPSVVGIVRKAQSLFDRKYAFPLYAVDFGISNEGKSYIFEINDQIGFPSSKMKNAKPFVDEIISSLIRLF